MVSGSQADKLPVGPPPRGPQVSCFIPFNHCIPLVPASRFPTGHTQGKLGTPAGRHYVLGLFPTDTSGCQLTGFGVVTATIPAITWRKDKST